MGERYFIRIRGRTLGPYDLEAIQQMARKAQVGRSHEISIDGVSWTAATAYPEIFERPPAATTQTSRQAAVETLGSPGILGEPGAPTAVTPAGKGLLWHYTMGGEQQGQPIDEQALINLIAVGRVTPDDSVWNETMSDWANVAYVPQLATYALPSARPTQDLPQIRVSPDGSAERLAAEYQAFVRKKIAAGVLALFLGNLGIHKFMLGLTTGGLTMLLLFFLIVPIPVLMVISLVEGVLYLTKSDEQFFQDYAVTKKQWL
jgi:TM2 domain-containing membrane protein YozV